MRYVEKKRKWYVLKNGDWLEFAGEDTDIEWRKTNKNNNYA